MMSRLRSMQLFSSKTGHRYNFPRALVLTLFASALPAFSIFDFEHWPFILVFLGIVAYSLIVFHRTFACSRFFLIAFVNGLSAYAYAFRMALDAYFPTVPKPLPEIAFVVPILAYLLGSYLRRKYILKMVGKTDPFPIGMAIFWLA